MMAALSRFPVRDESRGTRERAVREVSAAPTYHRVVALETLKNRIDRLPGASARTQRSVAVAVLITQALIAVTGSVVRVTGSGLGCSTWPQCQPGSMVPVDHPEFAALHQWIEFGNRLLTGVVGFVAVAAFVLARLDRPRRRRYVRLGLVMPVGVVVQAILGGLTVRFELLWWTVAVHFLVSAVMVWLATLFLHSIDEGDGAPAHRGPGPLRGLLPLMVAIMSGLLIAGTMVTGAGPHAGDPDTPRLGLPVDALAHVHAAFLFVFLGMLVAVGVMIRTDATAPPPLWRRFTLLGAVVLTQGALGFVQYWTGVPELLVSLHVLGAMAVIAATASLWAGTRERPLAQFRAGDEHVAHGAVGADQDHAGAPAADVLDHGPGGLAVLGHERGGGLHGPRRHGGRGLLVGLLISHPSEGRAFATGPPVDRERGHWGIPGGIIGAPPGVETGDKHAVARGAEPCPRPCR
jgi:heme a synthase